MYTSLLFLFLLFFFSPLALSKKWTPSLLDEQTILNTSNNFSSEIIQFAKKVSFNRLEFPISHFARLPVFSDQAMFLTYPDTSFRDYCSTTELEIHALLNTSLWRGEPFCEEYFCSNKYSTIRTGTSLPQLTALHNYCLYCSLRDPTNATDVQHYLHFIQSLNSSTQCPHFDKILIQSDDHCGGDGKPMLYHEFYNQTTSNKPFVCYCPAWDKYGYKCDAYAAFFDDFNYYGKNWIILVFNAVQFIFVVVTILVPQYVGACIRCKRSKAARGYYDCRNLFDLQFQAVFFLCLSILTMFIEEVVYMVDVTAAGKNFIRVYAISGLFRIISFYCLALSYATMLIQWHKIYSNTKIMSRTGNSKTKWSARIMTAIFYLSVAAEVILLVSLMIARVNPEVIYVVIALTSSLYLLVFLVGFSIYGLTMYCILRRANTMRTGSKVSEHQKTITIFMIISNIGYIFVYIIVLLMLIGYIIGYDYMGYFLGMFRNFFLDAGGCLMHVNLTYLLYKRKRWFSFYLPPLIKCFPNSIMLKKLKKKFIDDDEDIDDVKEKMKKQRTMTQHQMKKAKLNKHLQEMFLETETATTVDTPEATPTSTQP